METSFTRKYINSIIPAIISSVVLGTFSIIDGLFIGNKIGDIGLAAINFAWPITAFVQAVGFGIGMGGAICISIASTKEDEGRKYLFHTYFLLLVVGLVLMALLLPLKEVILTLFGAEGVTLELANEYITIVLIGTIFQMLGQGLVCICRNYNYNLYTMLIMSGGFVINLILDYVFIYVCELSLAGAALATLIAQGLTTLGCIVLLFKRKHQPIICFEKEKIVKILKNSVSPFGTYFTPNLLLIIINRVAFNYGGDAAVAAYTATSYITFIVLRLMQGVGDGMQPLISKYHGLHDKTNEYKTLKISTEIVCGIGIVTTVLCLVFISSISTWFGLSSQGQIIFEDCLTIATYSFLALAFIRILISYFYAKESNLSAFVLVYGEPLIGIIVVFTFPLFMDHLMGVWASTPVSQFIILIVGICLFAICYKPKHLLKKDEDE